MADTKKHINFNPVKEDKDGVLAKRAVWSTAAIELALKGLGEGRKLVANPFYEYNTKLLKGDLVFERTDEEIAEWKRCATDIIYFAEKYCQLLTPEGIQHIELRDYQKDYLRHLEKNRLSIFLSCRQSGKTTTSGIFMLHYILFNTDKNALVLGNKRKTAVEILDKAKKIFLELPYFLKPGVYKWNEAEIVLDNGCRLMAEATTINSGISFTFHCVLSDEFAHIQPNIIDKFYNNLFPVITAGRARFMITSTQNGYNLFYRLYKAAEAGENEYAPFKVDWWQVPEWNPDKHCWEKRDEAWHKMQVANYGGEEAFNSQFGTDFDLGANTLISRKILQTNKTKLVNFIEKIIPGVSASESWHWHPDYDISNLRREFLIITADLGEQLGQDRTIYLISRMINPGSAKFQAIGYFMNNTLEREDCARSLQELLCTYCNFENVLLSFERNTYGEMFVKHLEENQEKYKLIANRWDPSCLVKYGSEGGRNTYLGIKITPGNKSQHCILFKESYERGNFIFEAGQFMNELSNFCNQGNNKYAADWGHDDLVMAAVQTEFVKETLQYTIMKQTFDSMKQNQQESTYYNPYDMSGILNRLGDGSSNLNDFGGMYNPYQQDQYDGSSVLSRLTRMG
jgi:hypothetical protein